MSKKQQQNLIIFARADRALQDMYHNATMHYPWDLDLTDHDLACLADDASMAIQDINDRLGCTDKDWQKQIKLGFTHNERYYWLVSRITEYGKLYTWGRGGRTLAPDKLVSQRGGSSFRMKDSQDLELTKNEAVELIQIVEAFNQYVNNWNKEENIRAMILQSREYDLEVA